MLVRLVLHLHRWDRVVSRPASTVASGMTASSPRTRGSVVIPAHDEERGIVATLRSLLDTAAPGEFEVVVVCNGCRDATALRAREVAGCRVIEIEAASKIEALRAGDREATRFPRIYLDADVAVSTTAARQLLASLQCASARVAGVRGTYDLTGSSRSVRLFYEFRQRLPVFEYGVIGAGVYAMNEAGRRRFGDWPDVISDDGFINALFAPHERVTLEGHRTQVEAPQHLRELVRRGVRIRRGNLELRSGTPSVPARPAPPAGLRTALRSSMRTPRGVASALVFAVVTVAVRLRARVGPGGDWTAATRPG